MTLLDGILDFGSAPEPTYYDILSIGKSAAQDEIKRAYYAAVKRVSPEHNPREFEQIKAAYEALRDAQKRLKYDSKLELSPPEIMRLEDARAYLSMEKTGKAVKAYEDLLKKKPGNLLVMEGLAEAYRERGFINKAIGQYEKILAANEQDMLIWSDYTGCLLERGLTGQAEVAMQKAVALNEQYDLKNGDILLDAIIYYMDLDDDFTRICFDRLHKIGLATISTYQDPAMVIINMVLRIKAADFAKDALLLGKNIKPQDYGYEKIEKLLLIKELAELNSNEDFDDVFINMFELLIDNSGTPRERMEQLCMEGYLLNENPPLMRKQVRKTAVLYPRLFALNSSFFNKFLQEKNEQRLWEANYAESRSLLRKHPEFVKIFSDECEDDGDWEGEFAEAEKLTPVRTEPKIGRNDPCPCGSGKKYKKCCGS